jgi:hypothetical protein
MTSTKIFGPEYFSPIGDVHTPLVAIPPCKVCGEPSLGGVMVSMEPTAPVGRPIFTAEFFCADHNPGTFALMADRLYPGYRVILMEEPWRLKVQRLDRSQQEHRVKNV